MPDDLGYYAAATFAVVTIGLSKGGFSGVSSLAMPVFALAISPVRAAAILLPIMIVQDWVGVWAFRKQFSARNLWILLPASIVGIGAGWAMAAIVPEAAVRLAVGVISVAFVALMTLPDWFKPQGMDEARVGPGAFWGAITGFTSMISHSGGPPFLVYVIPQRLAPAVLAGTSTIFFAAVNLLKVPPYILLGQFSRENLIASAAMLPVAIVSTLAGVWLVRRISAAKFYGFILWVTFLIGVKLVYDGVSELLF
jgi:uncharacterized membrane protein YfcA